jgi:acetate kinase
MSAGQAQRVLVLNAGSSSLKFALFEGLERALHGQVEGIGAEPQFVCGELREKLSPGTRHDAALDKIIDLMRVRGIGITDLAACGHRLVHAGTAFLAPTLIDAHRLAEINELRALAPLHNGFGLDAIEAMRRAAPALPQVACFDTTFHATNPEVATRFAIPASLHAAGYRRFGFHGLNYEHVTTTLAERCGPAATARLLIFHLGNGSSICAVRNGHSTATTMGYSTLDGLDMGSRCGSIDPGVLLALQRREGMSLDALETLLYRESGLLALSGHSSDMREIEGLDSESCRFAIEHYCYWAARHAGSLAVALGGVDSIAFTGGIGCGSARVRAGIAAHLGWLGLELVPDRNTHPHEAVALISTAGSRCAAWVVGADEERAILRHVRALLIGRL